MRTTRRCAALHNELLVEKVRVSANQFAGKCPHVVAENKRCQRLNIGVAVSQKASVLTAANVVRLASFVVVRRLFEQYIAGVLQRREFFVIEEVLEYDETAASDFVPGAMSNTSHRDTP